MISTSVYPFLPNITTRLVICLFSDEVKIGSPFPAPGWNFDCGRLIESGFPPFCQHAPDQHTWLAASASLPSCCPNAAVQSIIRDHITDFRKVKEALQVQTEAWIPSFRWQFSCHVVFSYTVITAKGRLIQIENCFSKAGLLKHVDSRTSAHAQNWSGSSNWATQWGWFTLKKSIFSLV